MDKIPVLQVEKLTKRFLGTVAVNSVDLTVKQNEIHALIGENGAGKSTLCKMLTGVYSPDEGIISINGDQYHFMVPLDSMKAGVGMVYQERNLIGYLNGAQNICLGFEPIRGGFIDDKAVVKKSIEIREQLGISTPLDVPVEKLGAGDQQLIEIMRAFFNQPKLIILDEPTASLGKGEIEPFLKFVMQIKKNSGISVIYITHKLEEVFQIADVVTVLTEGQRVMSKEVKMTTQSECVSAMIRGDRIKHIPLIDKNHDVGDPVIKVSNITYDGKKHQVAFDVNAGEAVGFYGLVGSGRTELMEAIYGIRYAEDCKVWFAGEVTDNWNTFQMIEKGMILTPEKRVNGIFGGLSLTDNICSLFIDGLSNKVGFFNEDKAKKFADKVLKKQGVKYRDQSQRIIELSGGNIQKTIIGRSVAHKKLRLLVLDEPTAGMDLGAKSDIYVEIRRLVNTANIGIIFISSELEELLKTCDRIYVFVEGNIIKEFNRCDFDKENILNVAIRGGNRHG